MARKTPHEAPVSEYKERPLAEALADPKDIEKAEARATVDQIETYHQDNPTLSLPKNVQKAVDEVPETPEG